MSNTLALERRIELERKDAARAAYEDAAKTLESHATNDMYHKVMKLGAKLIRKKAEAL